jgi:cell wall-associated NlpC family hydrolase
MSVTHGVVRLPALDLRAAPGHPAELVSQLLMGETLTLLSPRARRGWWRVRARDGYEGWARGWGFVPASAARARRWTRAARATVTGTLVRATSRPGGGVAVCPLFLGSRVIPGRAAKRWRAIELPDGRRAWVGKDELGLGRDKPPRLIERVTSLLGTPYLWGGRTPAGMDCSAFVQLVLAEQGIEMPRDAAQQHAASRALPPGKAPREGDLVFFAARGEPVGHVGIAVGGGYFAHCRGAVGIGSLESDNPLCENDLTRQLVGWFRPGRGSGVR